MMSKNNKGKEKTLKNNFNYDGEQSEYGFRLKKKPNLWWLLLLLLLLLLLIPLKKDITVITQVDGNPEPYVDVSMSHTGKYLLWDWHFLVDRPFDTIQQTDAEGKTVFKGLGYSVYSYIFHHKDTIVFSAGGDCYETVTEAYRFHKKLRKVTLDLDPKTADVRLKVIDSELGFEIPGATVEVEYDGRNGLVTVVDSTDAAGCVVVRDVRVCGGIGSVKASADGYADTSFVNLEMSELMEEVGGYQIPLRPLKDRFTFFVKNKYTKQPIPDALAEVTLTLNGQIGSVGHSRTNVDGLGQGFFDNARLLAKVEITASKRPEYLDGRFVSPSGRELTVREFKALPDSLRVVWLIPEPQAVEFRNVDTLTGQPIAGVKNEILIESIDGTTRTTVETSNRNGCFPVKALPGDKITIKSTLDPYYHPKTTVIDKFDKGEIIYMRPVKVSLVFRTVEINENGQLNGLLPDCNLEVTVDGRKVNPTNSGNGEFEVPDLLLTSKISIKASKPGHGSNDTKVRDKSVEYLWKARQDERDIPLEKHLKLVFRTVEEVDGSVLPDCNLVITVDGRRVNPNNSGNGEFTIDDVEPNAKISIVATKPGYDGNNTKVNNRVAKDLMRAPQEERDIPLLKHLKLVFRTVEVVDGVQTGVLPDCNLVITVDGRRVNPTNSGNGEFVIEDLEPNSRVSIEATKPGYEGNKTKVYNRRADELMGAPQDARDIPLVIPGCDAGKKYNSQSMGEGSAQYRVGKGPLSFRFKYDTQNVPDSFRIYIGTINDVRRGNAKLIKEILNESSHGWKEILINLQAGEGPYITVVANFEDSGSVFEYIVECPE